MTLVIPPSPGGWTDLIQSPVPFGLSRRSLAPSQAKAQGGLEAAVREVKDLELSTPLPVFVIGFRRVLTALKELGSAQPARWSALCLNGGEAASTIDFEVKPGGGLQLVKVTPGEPASCLAAAIEKAAGLAESTAVDYELRLVDIPSTGLKALWLRKKGAPINEDLFISLCARNVSEKLRTYTAAEWVENAVRLFKERGEDWMRYRKSRSYRWAFQDSFETLRQGIRRRFLA